MEVFIALVGFALALAGVGMLAYLWVMLLAVIFPMPLALFIGVFTSSYAVIGLLMREEVKPKANPESCSHTEWTDCYDYTTYPGAVKVVESKCVACGTPQKGSGQ